jgi:hypothetical protein
MLTCGSTRPTPDAKATALAVCPDGKERERGILTWRAA